MNILEIYVVNKCLFLEMVVRWAWTWKWNEAQVGLPAKNGEGDREDQSLNSDAGAESMERSVVGVTVSWLGDGKPSVLRIFNFSG